MTTTKDDVVRALVAAEPKATDYCKVCGESPLSGSHMPGHGHLFISPASQICCNATCAEQFEAARALAAKAIDEGQELREECERLRREARVANRKLNLVDGERHRMVIACDEYRAEIAALTTRRDELLALVANLSQSVPLESEVAEALNQRGALLAEVGTLRARLVDVEREFAWRIDNETRAVKERDVSAIGAVERTTNEARTQCGVCLDGATSCPVVDPPNVTRWTCLACGRIVGEGNDGSGDE